MHETNTGNARVAREIRVIGRPLWDKDHNLYIVSGRFRERCGMPAPPVQPVRRVDSPLISTDS